MCQSELQQLHEIFISPRTLPIVCLCREQNKTPDFRARQGLVTFTCLVPKHINDKKINRPSGQLTSERGKQSKTELMFNIFSGVAWFPVSKNGKQYI